MEASDFVGCVPKVEEQLTHLLGTYHVGVKSLEENGGLAGRRQKNEVRVEEEGVVVEGPVVRPPPPTRSSCNKGAKRSHEGLWGLAGSDHP